MTQDTQPPAPPQDEILLLNLIAPPVLADALAEWLLEREDVPGFTSVPVAGHGSSERSMTLAEQVAGHSRQVLFFTYLPAPTARALIAGLHEQFPASGMNYWLIPVVTAGRLD